MEEYLGKLCPYCRAEIGDGDSVKVCPQCGIPHHFDCWIENRGCTTFGCSMQLYEEQHTNPTSVCVSCGAPLGDGQTFCPKCGTPKNAPQRVLCVNCGTELKDGQDFCPKCGTPKNAPQRVLCVNCGTELRDGQAFCHKCGTPKNAPAAPAQVITPPVQTYTPPVTPTPAPAVRLPDNKGVRSYDAILYSVLCTLAGILLWVDGFYKYLYISYYSYYSTRRTDCFAIMCEDVFSDAGLFLVPGLIVTLLIGIIVFEWIAFGKGKRIKAVGVVFSAVNLGIFILTSILGAAHSRFVSFGAVFYIELLIFSGLLALSIINSKGKALFKKKSEPVPPAPQYM